MKQVSPEYQKAIQLHRTQGIRNSMHAIVSFGIIDSSAASDATVTTSPDVSFSEISGILSGENTVTNGYASWEQDFWQLNGKQLFLNTENPLKTGYISQGISDSNGEYGSNPYINIQFSNPHSMVGLTIQFDTVTGTCPKNFFIMTYLEGVVVESYHITNNTDIVYQGELGIENVDQIRIEFLTSRPHNRIRINSLVYGIAYSFSDADLISIVHNRSTSPISLELPAESFSFTLFNEDGKYNIDSEFSVIKFLEKEQIVTVQYGYEIDNDGTIEWLSPFTYWLQSWQTDGYQATFTCKDIFNRLLNTKYYKGIADGQVYSTRNLAIAVMEDAGVSDYWVDDYGLQVTGSYLPLPYASHAENLQLLGNLGRSSLEQNSKGGINFRNREQVNQSQMGVFTFDAPQTSFSYYYSGETLKGGVYDPSETRDYATWEEDFFALDGGMAFLPEEGSYLNSGYVSDVFPEGSGEYPHVSFDTAPAIELDFTRNITFGTLVMDMGKSSSADKFFLRAKRDSTPGEGHTTLVTVFEKFTQGINKDGKIYFNENFDRIVRLQIVLVRNPKSQRGRIKRVEVKYPMYFELLPDDVIGNPKGELLERCSNLTLNATRAVRWVGTPNEPKQTISVMPNTLTEIKHSEVYYACRFECDNSSVIIEKEEHYAFVSYIQISGVSEAADVKLYANTYASETTIPYNKTLNTIGEPVTVDNPIYSENSKQGPETVDWMGDYLSKRNQYTVETLGYPELDPGDLITYDGKEATVIQANINFNQGAMRETLVLRGEDKK